MADNIKFGLQLELKGDQAVVRGLDGTRHAVADLDREVDGHTRTTQTAAETNRTYASSFGSLTSQAKAFSGVLAAIGAYRVAAGAVDSIADFEYSIAGVKSVTNATAAELEAMTAVAKELGSTTRFSASQAAEGMRFLGMAGFDTNEIIGAMPATLSLAAAANIELGSAADITSNIMSAFNIEAARTTEIADALATAAASANTDITQMGEAMKYVGPVAAALDISMQDSAAAIGALSNAGIQGSSAGTGLRRVLSGLANPTKEAATALTAMGISIDAVNPKTHSIIDLVTELKDANLSAADALTIFGDRGGPAILALTEQIPQLQSLTGAINDSEEAAKRMADTLSENLRGDWQEFLSSVEGVFLSIGDAGALSAMRSGVQSATGVVREFGDNLETVGEVGTVLASVLVGRLAASATTTSGAFLSAQISVIRYEAQLASLLGVSRTVAAAQTAMAATARGAAAAWALIGGPVGAATIAAAAIYSLQEEMKLVSGPANQVTSDINKLAASLEGLGEAQIEQTIASMAAKLISLQEAAAEADRKANESLQGQSWFDRNNPWNETIDLLKDATEATSAVTDQMKRLSTVEEFLAKLREDNKDNPPGGVDGGTSGEIDKATKALQDKIAVIETENQLLALGYSLEDAKFIAAYTHAEELEQALLRQQREQQGIIEGLEDEAAVLEDLDAQWQKVLDAAIDRRETFSDLEADIQLLQRELIAIQGGEAALRAFNREKAIEVALRSRNTEEWLPEEIARYRELVGQQYDLQTQIEILTNQADPYAELWIAALERVDEAFADAWAGAFDSFEDFADELENAFKRLLGELAHQAITQPIIVQVQGFFTGTGGSLGAGSGGAGGLPPGTSQVAGSLFSYGAEGFSGYGASALGIQGQGAVSATTQVAPWASALAGGYMGYQNSGARGAATGAAGGYYGAQAGASIGAYGGPIGAIAGAVIGGVLGALGGSRAFGGSKELFNAGYELGIESGELVVSGFNKWKKDGGIFGGGNKTSSKTFDLAPDIENAFVSTIEGTKSTLIDAYAALGIEISDAAFDGLTIATERIGNRKKSDEEFAAAVDAMIASFADRLAGAAAGAAEGIFGERKYVNTYEEATALAGALTSVNNIMRTFARETEEVSISGGLAAQEIIALAGGLDQLLAVTQAAYQFDTAFGLADGLDPLRAVLGDLGFTLAQVEQAATNGNDAIGNLFAGLSDAEKAALQPFIAQIQALIPELDQATESTNDALETERQLAAIRSERYSLETRLLTLQGDTNALRERELAQLDPSNRAIQELIWVLENQQAAAEQAAEAERELAAERDRIASEAYGLNTRLLTLQGDTNALRERELEQLDPTNRAIQRQIWALEDEAEAAEAAARAHQQAAQNILDAESALRSAFSAEQSDLQATISQFGDLGASLRDFALGITPSNPRGATTEQLRAQFDDVSRRALLGDTAALESLPGVGEALREAVYGSARTSEDLTAELAYIQRSTLAAADVADRHKSIAEQQLDELTSQVSALIDINDSVLSVRQAIDNLNAQRLGQLPDPNQQAIIENGVNSAAVASGAPVAAGNNTDLTNLRAEFQLLRTELNPLLFQIAANSKLIADVVEDWDDDSVAVRVVEGGV